MADVTLRAYVKEINNLIEQDQLDEAIAHSRHILETYPKHLETYRLLGKAYLEAKRFGDAADIFQRVLSAVPEDFVSHIGMAIVREDEGNLDAAIWHMERAFEANPANPAIRKELSRLIGRRDGIEPHKIRLTRGALARQYAQGELFPQAIAELRSALQEDPDRPDLELLLAKMYWQSEQYDAAKNICKQIIEKLPYSFEANRVMAAIYQATNNPEKASEFHRRLAGLDPYMAFVDSAASDPSEISASAVQIDHSDWLPGQPLPTADSAEPDWVSSLGVDLSEGEELPAVDSVPSWMGELEGEVNSRPGSPLAFTPEEAEEALSEDADIPEWMREAGWEASTGEIQEGPISFSDDELEALDVGGPMPIPEEERGDEEEIAPADIPDWLQDIAPSEIPAEPEPEAEIDPGEQDADKREFVPDWLADISSEADDVPPEPVQDTQEVQTPEPEIPEPVEDTQEVQTPEPETPEPTPAVVDLDDDDQPQVPTWVEDQAPGATSTIISWLGDRPGSDAVDEVSEIPVPDEAIETSPERVEAEAEDEVPSWLDGLELDELEEPTAPAEVDPSVVADVEASTPEDDEVPSWLAGVADAASDAELDFTEEAPAPAETPIEEPMPAATASESEPSVDDEEWLRDLAMDEVEEEPVQEQEAPDWLSEEEVQPAETETPAEVPDWLEGIAESEQAEIPQAETAEPDWMRGIETEDEIAEEPTAAPRQEVPDWLQGIADPSTADEGTPIESEVTSPDVDDEAPPSWLQDFPAEQVEAQPEQTEDEFDLDSLREFEAEISAEPDQEQAPITRSPEELGVGEELDDEEVYQWLESLADEQPEEQVVESPTADVAASVGEATPIIEESIPPEEPDASLDWLEDLASKRGLDVDVAAQEDASQLATPEPEAEQPSIEPEPEEATEEAPDWLREMASSPSDETVIAHRPAEFESAEVEPETEPEEAEIPGWLDEATSIAADVPAEPVEVEGQIEPEQHATAPPEPETELPDVMPVEEEILDSQYQPQEPQQVVPESTQTEAVDIEPTEIIEEPPAETPVTPPAAVVEPTTPTPEPEPEPLAEAPPDVAAEEPVSEPDVEAPAVEEKPPKFKEPLTEPTQLLQSARQALSAGDAGRALSDYRKLIDRKQDLETVITDLQRASERYPNLPKVWQALGDAYMKADQLPEAIKAYQRGMEVA